MKRHRFTCTDCLQPWYMVGENPDGHTEVICTVCLKRTYEQFQAELAHVEFALPLGYIEVPPALQALGLGHREFMGRLTAYRLGMPLEQLLGPGQTTLQ